MKEGDVKCLFCNGYFFIGKGIHPERKVTVDMLIHNMPPCPKFIALEPEDFVHEAYMAKVPQA